MTPATLKRLAEEALAQSEKATKGPWYFRCTDDAHAMNARMVCTEPTPLEHAETTYAHDGVMRSDFEEAICVTLHQIRPRICREDGKEEENAEFIASARTSLPQLARAVLALAPFVRHKPACIGNDPALDPSPCDCGLDAALERIGGKGEE